MLTLLIITLSVLVIANVLIIIHNTLKHRRLESYEFLVHLASVDLWEVAEIIGRVDDDLSDDIYYRVNASQDKLAKVRL